MGLREIFVVVDADIKTRIPEYGLAMLEHCVGRFSCTQCAWTCALCKIMHEP